MIVWLNKCVSLCVAQLSMHSFIWLVSAIIHAMCVNILYVLKSLNIFNSLYVLYKESRLCKNVSPVA